MSRMVQERPIEHHAPADPRRNPPDRMPQVKIFYVSNAIFFNVNGLNIRLRPNVCKGVSGGNSGTGIFSIGRH